MAADGDRRRAREEVVSGGGGVRERFRVLAGVFNPHNFVSRFGEKGVDDYIITYHGPGRAMAARTSVWSPHRQVAPKGHWQDYGAKAFVGARRGSQPEAIKWATAEFGITAWVPCPADPTALIPKTVRERGLAWLKAQEKKAKSDPARDQRPTGGRR